ncbi:MAG: uracil-DNA glycosylase [Anaerolineae bacterium]|nr:uracil-DNA glycosylase [Anaerolineae bacterium]
MIWRHEVVSNLSAQWSALNQEVVTCDKCPRLVRWREEVSRTKRRAYLDWDYWGKPVPGFGDRAARLCLIGLAPGAHGANRTGRMFTGDSSGDTLYSALYRAGFANQPASEARDDGLCLSDVFITAIGRCVPPQNRPNAQELDNCRPFLVRELAFLTNLQVVLALGHMAFDGYCKVLRQQGVAVPKMAFKHGAVYTFEPPLPALVACYHPSRQNTQTGRLTPEMLDTVFQDVKDLMHSL